MLDKTFEELVRVIKYGKKRGIPTIFNREKAGFQSVVSILVIIYNIIYINNIHTE
jgi:hypothetical protein